MIPFTIYKIQLTLVRAPCPARNLSPWLKNERKNRSFVPLGFGGNLVTIALDLNLCPNKLSIQMRDFLNIGHTIIKLTELAIWTVPFFRILNPHY